MPDIEKYATDEFNKMRLKKAFVKNAEVGGGTIEIDFRGFVVMAPLRDVLYNLEKIKSYTMHKRAHVMRSVNKSIDENFPKMETHELDTKRAVEIMQDIAIWFAHEVYQGRAKLP